ncbi:MAG: protein kinase, partial [Myxococcota bacterium]|nr:protein kinase [Myxococcota bacterium]
MSESLLDLLSPGDLPLQLGRYELQSILGEGGMARVFGAELHGPAGFRKQVAVKVIKQGAIDRKGGRHVASFIREARLGGLLKHPNIVDVYEFGEADGQLFIAMERVEGQTLDQIIRGGEKPPPAVVLEIAAGVAAGLASAHALNSEGLAAGLVHRDMKPSNVMVSWDGAVKVADFGIAITRFGELAEPGRDWSDVAGTISYMSAEQLRGEPLDGRSDLFSLGLVLVELSTATRLPRRYLYKRLVLGRMLHSPVIPDEYLDPVEEAVPGLRSILERCLDPRPDARYASAEELLTEIDSLRQQLGFFPRLRTWLQSAGQPPPMDVVEPGTAAVLTEPTGVTEPQLKTIPTQELVSRTNLGEPLDGFVGREPELAELGERFEAGVRLITVKGTGGAGKTRFACQLARTRSSDLAGGVWFVDLTEARTPEGVVHAVAMVLEVPLVGDGLDAMVLQVGHAVAGRGPVLLVLDNFEQVVECAAITVGRWLDIAPEASFLATSRSPLRLAGEQVFELEPLPEADGVSLFQLRARAAGATWREDSKTRTAITQIVTAVDGLPLAI